MRSQEIALLRVEACTVMHFDDGILVHDLNGILRFVHGKAFLMGLRCKHYVFDALLNCSNDSCLGQKAAGLIQYEIKRRIDSTIIRYFPILQICLLAKP